MSPLALNSRFEFRLYIRTFFFSQSPVTSWVHWIYWNETFTRNYLTKYALNTRRILPHICVLGCKKMNTDKLSAPLRVTLITDEKLSACHSPIKRNSASIIVDNNFKKAKKTFFFCRIARKLSSLSFRMPSSSASQTIMCNCWWARASRKKNKKLAITNRF